MRRKLFLASATLAITAMTAFMAQAGVWKNNNTGWWYDYGNGTYPASCWQWIDGNNDGNAECYYFNQNGYIDTNTTKDGYELNADGQWVVNGVVQTRNVGYSSATSNQQNTAEVNDEAIYRSSSKNNKGLNLMDVDPAASMGTWIENNIKTTRDELWAKCIRFWGYNSYRAYLLNGEYDTMTFKYAPLKDFNDTTEFSIQIYGDDDTLIWESEPITYKTKTTTETVDISGQDEIRIFINPVHNWSGEILIKDLYVK